MKITYFKVYLRYSYRAHEGDMRQGATACLISNSIAFTDFSRAGGARGTRRGTHTVCISRLSRSRSRFSLLAHMKRREMKRDEISETTPEKPLCGACPFVGTVVCSQ